MTLYLIGLGLSDEKDITIKGLEIVRQCHTVYLESYTSLLAVTKEKLENFYGRPLIEADRELMELSNEILEATKSGDVAVLIVGDPFSATTHTDLVLRAREKNINVEIIHNASIMTAIGVTGLQLYNFGRTVTVPFWTDTWRPTSFYDKIKINLSGEMHTLCLLDIKVKEQSIENLLKRKKIFEPPRYMTINECIEQLLQCEEQKQENVIRPDMLCVGVARVGQPNQKIVAGSLKELATVDFGPPLHSFIICGSIHPMEREYLSFYNFRHSTSL